ncbi:hypothetical protein AAFF_G00246090 [Aldrovandia affinis]|uniref:Uncharacterized protein n=1 Tax=Aldrovandia affinis TaxID=143900 RepID=A0AAD7WTE6_9TELE|nr:hypothetical protein AAFF_G00246090 [Aldrovandia affinis]
MRLEGACFSASSNKESLEHPESSAAEQKKFLNHLKALCDLVKDDKVVNPFKEMGPDLITLDTGEVMDHEISNCLREAPNIGKAMFMEFVRDRIEKATKPFSDVIPRANLFTFTNRPAVDLKKGANKLGSAKANTALVTKLFLSLQARPEFFKHENQREPPSLSDQGKLLSGTKSDILGCLLGIPDPGHSPAA